MFFRCLKKLFLTVLKRKKIVNFRKSLRGEYILVKIVRFCFCKELNWVFFYKTIFSRIRIRERFLAMEFTFVFHKIWNVHIVHCTAQ